MKETLQQKLQRLTATQSNSLYKNCDTCKDDATIEVNNFFNQNPIYDETETCPECSTGRIVNQDVIEDRLFEYENLIISIHDKIKRLKELESKVYDHQFWLREKIYTVI
jgi:hypothetical protein